MKKYKIPDRKITYQESPDSVYPYISVGELLELLEGYDPHDLILPKDTYDGEVLRIYIQTEESDASYCKTLKSSLRHFLLLEEARLAQKTTSRSQNDTIKIKACQDRLDGLSSLSELLELANELQ